MIKDKALETMVKDKIENLIKDVHDRKSHQWLEQFLVYGDKNQETDTFNLAKFDYAGFMNMPHIDQVVDYVKDVCGMDSVDYVLMSQIWFNDLSVYGMNNDGEVIKAYADKRSFIKRRYMTTNENKLQKEVNTKYIKKFFKLWEDHGRNK